MIDLKKTESVRQFLSDTCAFLDNDQLELWGDCFTDDALYRILSRDNHDRGLPLSLLTCEGKSMIRDRIKSLRQANIYNIHTDRHILSELRFISRQSDQWQVETSYAMFQTNQEGHSFLFSVGVYKDTVVFAEETPKLKQRLVITDTAAIRTLLSTPI
jgi:anthranilate 1,2-dioxygenase small subunit